MALFDYNGVRTFTDTLQVDDIGNCTIKCEGTYQEGRVYFPCYYYLLTKTVMGKTAICKFGPIDTDFIGEMPHSFEVSFKKIAYKERAIAKEIQLFINDGLKGVTKAEEVLEQEAYDSFPSLQGTFDSL